MILLYKHSLIHIHKVIQPICDWIHHGSRNNTWPLIIIGISHPEFCILQFSTAHLHLSHVAAWRYVCWQAYCYTTVALMLVV
jgi:hypothetical protein